MYYKVLWGHRRSGHRLHLHSKEFSEISKRMER
jgi:hypothetical protein